MKDNLWRNHGAVDKHADRMTDDLRLAAATSLLAGYLAAVCGLNYVLLTMLLAATVAWHTARRLLPAAAARTLASTFFATVLVCVSVDTLFTIANNRRAESVPPDLARYTDPVTWIGELYPPLYWDAATGVRLAKPGYHVSGAHYGDGYTQALFAAPTLQRDVFSLKHVTVTIDDRGYRNTIPPHGARIFTLGDSFTFGWGVSDDETWSARLADRLQTPVYNLGVHDSSPVEEVRRLRMLLESTPAMFHPQHVCWLLFEGNDLEDSRALVPADAAPHGRERTLLADTVLDYVAALPGVVQRQSVIDRFVRGTLHWRTAADTNNPWVVDGIRSPHPIFHSARHGTMLWLADQLERARAPRTYEARHPNRRRLAGAVREMAQLADRYGFQVTVAIAPTVVRLYAPYVDDLDPPLAPPYFIRDVTRQIRRAGLTQLDLLAALEPFAAQELLYFRDDDHWNPRGHAVVAELFGEAVERAEASVNRVGSF